MVENQVMEEVMKGQERLDQLKVVLRGMLPSETQAPDSPVTILLENISGSFSRALICLNSSPSFEVLQDQASPCSNGHRNENTSRKRAAMSVKKIGYRRRANPSSCKKVLNRTVDDGYTWRKYGQKDIFSSKFPRSYFRCTHKFNQDCQATRQVQRSEQNPDMYEITYIGEHICNQSNKQFNQFNQSSEYIINFNSNTEQQQVSHLSSPSPPNSLKIEREEEVTSNSNSEKLILPEAIEPLVWNTSATTSDHCDMSSGFQSSDDSLDFGFNSDFDMGFFEF